MPTDPDVPRARASRNIGVPQGPGSGNTELWEQHADWWIAAFTDGADPEYDDQILPLAAAEAGWRLAAETGAEVVRLSLSPA